MRKLVPRAFPYQIDGIPDYLASLLHARGVHTFEQAQAFLNPEMKQLHDSFSFDGMRKACQMILRARAQKKSVVVYGDYDADGICASAILLEALGSLGIRAFYYIPERQSEGYGLNADAIKKLSKQAELMITVDCGITAVSEIQLAKDLGMDVVLTDHHALQESLPLADVILHPQLSQAPEEALCGAGVAWQLARALTGDEANHSIELAALATIADMVPLLGQNRVITSLGLQAMSKLVRPGIRALAESAGIKTPMISAEQVAFQLAPRLNAGGRLTSAEDALRLLLTQDQAEAHRLAQTLDQQNRDRKQVEQQVIQGASDLLKKQKISQSRSIVLAGEGWNPGVVGLAAGRLAERWNYPTVVLTEQEEGYTGSARSAGGIDLFMALSRCQHLFTRFGGHEMAAGLSLPKKNLEAFRLCFDEAVRQQLAHEDLTPETQYDSLLPLMGVNLQTVHSLKRLEPFGMGNPKPLFLLDDLKVISARGVGSEGAHLKLSVAQGGEVREGIAFSQGRLADRLSDRIRMVASVEENHFNGKTTAQLVVKAIQETPGTLRQNQRLEAQSLMQGMIGLLKDGGAPLMKAIPQLPQLSGTRGTLLVAHLAQTANQVQLMNPQLQIFTAHAKDPRAYHCIVYAPDWRLPFAPFEQVIFLDGKPDLGQAQLLRQQLSQAELLYLPENPEKEKLLRSFSISIEELRQAYVLLRQADTNLFPACPGKEVAALFILKELNLIALDDTLLFAGMLPMSPIDPRQSKLFCSLSTH